MELGSLARRARGAILLVDVASGANQNEVFEPLRIYSLRFD
jgi:hypothetical protein